MLRALALAISALAAMTLAGCASSEGPVENSGAARPRPAPDSAPGTRSLKLDAPPTDLAWGAGGLWVATLETVILLAPTDGRILERVVAPGGDGLRSIAVSDDAVWISDPAGETVTRIDPASGEAVTRVAVPGEPWRSGWGEDPSG